MQILGNQALINQEISRISSRLAAEPECIEIQLAYDFALKRLDDCQTPPVHPNAILETFGLRELSDSDKISILSGGQKTRLAFALVMISDPDMLILDEPRNHLDVAMLEWLEIWINRFSGGILIVSHDRTFLDNTVNQIVYLDPDTHRVKVYTGNYSEYLDQFQLEHEKRLSQYRRQIYETRLIKQDIARTKEQAHRVEMTTSSR